MALPPGTRFGPYEIVAPLGAAAWVRSLARGTGNLDRDVGLKAALLL